MLFFDLERLKFAFIFLFLYLLYLRKWLIIPAIFSHIFILIPIILNILTRNIFSLKTSLRKLIFTKFISNLVYALILIIIFIFFIKFFVPQIIYKFKTYHDIFGDNVIFEIWKLQIFLILTLATCHSKKKVLFFFGGLTCLAIFVGASRINLLGYFGFLYFSNFKHRFFMYLNFPLTLYFFSKSCFYVYRIYHERSFFWLN